MMPQPIFATLREAVAWRLGDWKSYRNRLGVAPSEPDQEIAAHEAALAWLDRQPVAGSVTQAPTLPTAFMEGLAQVERGDDVKWLFFQAAFDGRSHDIHELACEKGWWDDDRNNGELLALIHSEVSEVLEAYRAGNPPDDKLPAFSAVEVELADIVIRVMDMAAARGFKVGAAILAKHALNKSRPRKHNKEF